MPNIFISFRAIPDVPSIQPDDDLVQFIIEGIERAKITPQDGDILIVSSKVVSKAENRFVDLRTILPSSAASALALKTQKNPRLVELILRESEKISRHKAHVLVVRHKLGFTSSNAGIDASNIETDDPNVVLLLPQDPNASAAKIHEGLSQKYGVRLGIIISDTHGRAHRLGNVGVAIGVAGMPALIDQRGDSDLYGRELEATITPLADELATAGGLISGQADEGQPIVFVRGVHWEGHPQNADVLIRPPEQDLYD